MPDDDFSFDSVGQSKPLEKDFNPFDFDLVGEEFDPIIIFLRPTPKRTFCPDCGSEMESLEGVAFGCDFCGRLKYPCEPVLVERAEETKLSDSDLMIFGKHKGSPLKNVPSSYFRWLMEQEGFKERNPDLAEYIVSHHRI